VDDCFKDQEKFPDAICRFSPYYDDPFDECLLAYKCSKTTADFASFSTCKQNGLLEANYIFSDMLQNEITVNEYFLKGEAMSVIRVSIDWRLVPIQMQFLEHYQLVFNTFNATKGVELHEIRPGSLGTWFGQSSVDKHGILNFNIICLRDTYFRFDVELLHGLYIENKNYSSFRDTVKFVALSPQRAWLDSEELVQFYILLPKSKLMGAPVNLIPPESIFYGYKDARTGEIEQKVRFGNKMDPIVGFTGDNLSTPLIPQAYADKKNQAGLNMLSDRVWPVTDTFEHTHYVLPYLPFFSSCRGFDSQIPLFLLLESEENCNLVDYNETIWIDQWNPFTKATAVEIDTQMDRCSWIIPCKYEEEIEKVSNEDRWFEIDAGTDLFYISRDPHPYKRYSDAYAGNDGDAMKTGLDFFVQRQFSSEMVAVVMKDSTVPVDEKTKSIGVPRSVTLTIQYYQRSKARKRIVMASLTLDDYSPNEQRGEIVRDYSLIVEYKALDYLSLLNGFSLDPLVYVVLFFITGIATLTFYVVFWAFQRVFTRLQRPPKLAVRAYLRVIISPVRGCALAFLPCSLVFSIIHGLFRSLRYPLFSGINELYTDFGKESQWSESQRTSVATIVGLNAERQVQHGRIAVALLTFGLYLVLTAGLVFMPGKREQEDGIMSLFDPKSLPFQTDEQRANFPQRRIDGWYRTQYLLGSFVSILACTVVLEFSYSDFFQTHLYPSIVSISIFYAMFQSFLVQLLGDELLVQPMVISFNVIETVVLMGSPSFLDFIQLFLFQLLFKTAMRMYALPGVQSLKDLASYLGTVMARLKERRRREEDLEEGEDLDNNEDDVLNSVEFEGSSPVFTQRVFYNSLICTRLIVISSPGFTRRIFYTNQILHFIRTLHRTHIYCFFN
jgi:hypothetical protein